MKNSVTELLRIEYPIIQAGLELIAGNELAAAASLAGGLGVIGAAGMSPDRLQEEINLVRQATDRPFGVNLRLMDNEADELARIVAINEVPVVICRDGTPANYMTMWKEAGVIVVPLVNSVSMARMMEDLGADALIAQGMESGGSIGSSTTMSLVPQVVDAVGIPVIASGGICDGRGIAASIMLGAQGVQMGTRFAVAFEAAAHENYKKKIISAKDQDSEVVGLSLGRPVRAIKNGLTREYQKKEKAGAGAEELEMLLRDGLKKAVVEGDIIRGLIEAGQGAGMVKEERSCGEILHEVLEEAEWLLLNGPQHG